MSRIDEGVDEDAALSAISSSESEDSESSQQSAAQVDTEAQLEETSATAVSSESNRDLQPTSREIEICSHPYQPSIPPPPKSWSEYRSFKASWYDNRNWLHWESATYTLLKCLYIKPAHYV